MQVSSKIRCLIITLMLFWGLGGSETVQAVSVKPMGKNLYKRIESVEIVALGQALDSKMDTGADTSSLSAANIESYHENGLEYVRFSVAHPKLATTVTLSKPVVRWIKIKRRIDEKCGSRKPYSRRPVVKLQVKLRGRVQEIFVSLADRRNMRFPMLFGRSAILKYRGVIDPAI